MAPADLSIPLMPRSPIWTSFPHWLWDIPHPQAGHKKGVVLCFNQEMKCKKHRASPSGAAGSEQDRMSKLRAPALDSPALLSCTEHTPSQDSSCLCLHQPFNGSTRKEGPFWYLCGGKQNKSISECCCPRLGQPHSCAQTNTRLRGQVSLLKWTTRDRGTAQDRRFVWCEPKASVVLPTPGTCICIWELLSTITARRMSLPTSSEGTHLDC